MGKIKNTTENNEIKTHGEDTEKPELGHYAEGGCANPSYYSGHTVGEGKCEHKTNKKVRNVIYISQF